MGQRKMVFLHPCVVAMVGLFLVPRVSAEIFTSVQELSQIFTVERHVVNALSDYVTKTEARLLEIRKYLRSYEQVQPEMEESMEGSPSKKAADDGLSERLAGNPIHVYHLIKRLTLDWNHIEEHDPNADWKVVENEILKGEIFGFSQFDNEEDLKGTAQALLRLQTIYNLNATSLARGNVAGVQTTAELTAQDCLYLGKNSLNEGAYSSAMEWLEQAFILAGLERNNTGTQDEAMVFLNVAAKMYEKTHGGNTNGKPKQSEVFHKEVTLGEGMPQEDTAHSFAALCRGEQLLSDAYVATLKCYYDHRNASYLILMPAKVEQRHHNPQILMFHDAIRDDEIELIKEVSTTRLFRSTVLGAGGNGSTVSTVRTSKNAWLYNEEEMTTFRNFNLRISYLTNLLTTTSDNSAERLQTANYGIGGHYLPHHDYLMKDKTEAELRDNFTEDEHRSRDRIATIMFYLSNVNRGGATAFPKLGVALFPEKGAAAFWYNLKKTGAADRVSLHGGCPVIHGSKWVSNKWIREGNQFRHRPCSLSEDE